MSDRDTTTATPLPCPFCARAPKVSERPASDADGGGYFCFIACYCDGFSACAHKMARADTAAAARAGAISIWNRRALAAAPSPAPSAPSQVCPPTSPSLERTFPGLAAQALTQEPGPWLIEHTDGHLEKTFDRELAYLARHLGHTVTPLHAAPVGQADPWPEDPTPAMLEALRTGSRKDYPSDELCRVRYAALRAAVGAVAGQAEDVARWRALAASAKEELLDPHRAASEVAPDLRTHWVLPTLICSGPVGGHMTFAKSVDVLRARQAVQPQPGDAA